MAGRAAGMVDGCLLTAPIGIEILDENAPECEGHFF